MTPGTVNLHWQLTETSVKRLLLARGDSVIPTQALVGNAQGTFAPMAETQEGKVVLPDYIVASRRLGRIVLWACEVKAKDRPYYRRDRSRWEHGTDHDNFRHYQRIEERFGHEVFVVLSELNWPLSAAADRDASGAWQPRKGWGSGRRLFLYASLGDITAHGYHSAAAAPKFRGGAWNWRRSLMQPIDSQLSLLEIF